MATCNDCKFYGVCIMKRRSADADVDGCKVYEAGMVFEERGLVEVVRCKDCKHWHEETGWCEEHSHFVDRVGDFCYPEENCEWKMFGADYFCKDGERKDND